MCFRSITDHSNRASSMLEDLTKKIETRTGNTDNILNIISPLLKRPFAELRYAGTMK